MNKIIINSARFGSSKVLPSFAVELKIYGEISYELQHFPNHGLQDAVEFAERIASKLNLEVEKVGEVFKK